MTAPPLLRLTGITKRFPGVVALSDVDLTLDAGVVHALTGENGSGKSTLARIASGALAPDAGRIEVDGIERTIGSPREALELGIVTISQELTLAPTLSVAENIFIGRLPRGRHAPASTGPSCAPTRVRSSTASTCTSMSAARSAS